MLVQLSVTKRIMDKNNLRKKYRDIRKNISNRKDLDKRITKNFLAKFGDISQEKIVAGYIAIDGEVNPLQILKYYNNNGNLIAIPKLIDGQMFFTNWNLKEKLIFDRFYQTENNIFSNPNIVIVPLIAFNNNCYRLGFGKGFYDKIMDNLKIQNIKFVGIAYEQQYCNQLIVEKHDQNLNYIVTDQNIH